MWEIAGGNGSSRLLIVVSNGNSRDREEGLLKRSGLGAFSVLAIAVSAAALVYADGNQGAWCPLDPGAGTMGDARMVSMEGRYNGPHDGIRADRMGPGNVPMGPGDGGMSPFAGHMDGSLADNVTARREKNGDFVCPGRTTQTGVGSGDTGNKVEKNE